MERAVARVLGVTLVLGLVSGVQLSAACGSDDDDGGDHDHDGGEHDKPVGKPSGAECPGGSTLTYESFGQQFMSDYCVRCHSSSVMGADRKGAPAGHDFDSLAGIQLVSDHVDQKAAAGPSSINTAMPPSDPRPSMEEREQLGEWLACGAP